MPNGPRPGSTRHSACGAAEPMKGAAAALAAHVTSLPSVSLCAEIRANRRGLSSGDSGFCGLASGVLASGVPSASMRERIAEISLSRRTVCRLFLLERSASTANSRAAASVRVAAACASRRSSDSTTTHAGGLVVTVKGGTRPCEPPIRSAEARSVWCSRPLAASAAARSSACCVAMACIFAALFACPSSPTEPVGALKLFLSPAEPTCFSTLACGGASSKRSTTFGSGADSAPPKDLRGLAALAFDAALAVACALSLASSSSDTPRGMAGLGVGAGGGPTYERRRASRSRYAAISSRNPSATASVTASGGSVNSSSIAPGKNKRPDSATRMAPSSSQSEAARQTVSASFRLEAAALALAVSTCSANISARCTLSLHRRASRAYPCSSVPVASCISASAIASHASRASSAVAAKKDSQRARAAAIFPDDAAATVRAHVASAKPPSPCSAPRALSTKRRAPCARHAQR
mmetsp:Transcript_22750/g.53848  ORF Transcript_22750/g.53848 Transcript_22750/m.53848 type:complete len:467 (-) Transcript_22750:165-1565(-)